MKSEKVQHSDSSLYLKPIVKVEEMRPGVIYVYESLTHGRARYVTHTLHRQDIWVDKALLLYLGRAKNHAFNLEKATAANLEGPWFYWFVEIDEAGIPVGFHRATQDFAVDAQAKVNGLIGTARPASAEEIENAYDFFATLQFNVEFEDDGSVS